MIRCFIICGDVSFNSFFDLAARPGASKVATHQSLRILAFQDFLTVFAPVGLADLPHHAIVPHLDSALLR
jgi:hypothetical protein